MKGYTLIELVLYVGILAILIGALSSIFSAVLDVQLESTSGAGVDQDGRYLLAKFSHDVASSSAILVPANPGTTSSTMQITVNSINYTYSVDGNNNLQIINNSTNETNELNSYDTSVSGLTFTRIGSGDSNDTIQITYTLTSREKNESGQTETRSYVTTVGEK